MGDDEFNIDPDFGDFTDENISSDEDLEKMAEVHTPVNIEVDTTQPFEIDMEFESREIAINYVRKCRRKHGVVVVVKRSDANATKRTPRIILACERSGGYRGKDNVLKRRSSTKKCGCPFSLRAYVLNSVPQRWHLTVVNEKHNHALVKCFEGYSFMGRLTREERDTVERLCKTGVRSRDILNSLKLKDPTNATTMKTIYNVRTVMRVKELFNLLLQNGYVVRHRSEANTEVVKDLFFSCSTSIKLARAFPFVFMLDCTYKTNKYRLPLLQVVGVTSTMKNFCVAFCYTSSEKEETYGWALCCFRDLFDTVLACVFFNDRKVSLMIALKTVFLAAKNLLCRVHISRNVLTNYIGLFNLKSKFDDFMVAFASVMHSYTVAEYEQNVAKMHERFKGYPKALSYVNESWLNKYKTYFVYAYINQFFHIDNTTNNRVEGSHSKLKKYLSTSVGGFVQSFTHIHLLLQGQVIDVKASFEDSLTRMPIRFRTWMYKDLVNIVSTAVLEKIESEFAFIGSLGIQHDKVNVRGRKKGQRSFKGSLAYDKSTRREPSAFEHALDGHVFEDVQPIQPSQCSSKSVQKEKQD
ncbi:protein FAR1-RELATED SEQUENCE 5-like [Tripterygium wilfordii]|uniref:protein FAR1-RELATED SEQUENCE 5-like n=1 Tax=Tripterygium wilfordii TaxID=458696 RepID=UPI0018F83963|nr:protein FAR1-RELATED SEQUENCE 5-like [Tripterygium wilfordii]